MYRNETPEAFSFFQKAYDLGGFAWPAIHDNISLLFSSIMTFPGFNNLKNNPEFLAIVKRIEDNRAALREKVREMEQRREINL